MTKLLLAAALSAAVGLAAPAAANLITNGDFETNSLTGWTTNGGTYNGFFADAVGTSSPLSGNATPANPTGGSYYAVGDQIAAGVKTMRQSFTTTGNALTLSFDWFDIVRSSSGQSGTALTTANNTENMRVDILTATADELDTGTGVVQNLLLNQMSSTWKTSLFNLNLAAGTYQLRFASSECCYYQQFGIDNVSLNDVTPTAVPEPAMLGLFGLGAIGLGLSRRRKAA